MATERYLINKWITKRIQVMVWQETTILGTRIYKLSVLIYKKRK